MTIICPLSDELISENTATNFEGKVIRWLINWLSSKNLQRFRASIFDFLLFTTINLFLSCGKTRDLRKILHQLYLFLLFFRQWSKETHDFFRDLWISGLAKDCGISLIPCIRLSIKPEGFPTPSWSNIVFGYAPLNEQQLNQFSTEHGTPYTGGAQYVTFTAEPIALLPYLYKRFEKAGGRFERRKVFKFDELADEKFDLVINCTGVKAEQLAKDSEVTPIRGQVMRVKAPWLFQSIQADENYVIPK